MLRSVAVTLTSGCNLQCGYCFQDRGRRAVMPWVVLRCAIDALLGGGAAEPELVFAGGEPLLALPLMRRAARYVARRAPEGVAPRFTVTTNGTLLSREAVRFLAARRVRTFISCDGVAAAQELRAPGSSPTLDVALRFLGEEYPHYLAADVTVAVTLSSANVGYLGESVRYFLDLGVRHIGAWPLATRDAGWNDERAAVLDHQLAEVYTTCRQQHRRTGEVPFLPFRRKARRRARPRRDIAMCRIAAGHSISVDTNGDARACGALSPLLSRLPNGTLERAAEAAWLGPVAAAGIEGRLSAAREALRALPLFDGKERKRSRYGKCGSCAALRECRVCPLSIAYCGDDPNVVPPLPCAFFRLAARYRRRFPVLEASSSFAGR